MRNLNLGKSIFEVLRVKYSKFIYSFAAILLSLTILGSCNNEHSLQLAKATSYKATEKAIAGNYLAGRFAQHQQDWRNAQKHMSQVFEQDKEDKVISERTFLLSLGSGKLDHAKELAERFSSRDSNLKELAIIFLTCDAINNGDYETALKSIDQIEDKGFGQFTKPLLRTWTLVGLNRIDEAKQYLEEKSFNPDPTYHIHAGLIEELTNNNKEAERHYKIAMTNGLELHTALIVANFFERTNRADIAISIYQNLDKLYPYKPFMRSRTTNKDFTNIRDPKKGAALALFDLTSILYNNRSYDSAKIYGNIVQMLEDDNSDIVRIMMGDIAAVYNHHGEALDNYNSIEANSPLYWLSRTRVSEVYELQGKYDKAIDILKVMARDVDIRTEVMASLGDLHRRNNDFESAVEAYDKALEAARSKGTQNQHWAIIYARGIAKEQSESWANAEKDLLSALKMQPHNPNILNFIAYSWAEKNIKLEQALKFVKKAAILKPYDGSILDSYGWILFKLGNYEEAADMLEEAVELLPDDAVILDHLGDAYWKTNRRTEARHQWRKAANNAQNDDLEQVVLEKIKYGIITADELEKRSAKK